MFAIYAFSRAVDDVADEGDAPQSERREELDRWRADIEAVYKGLRPDRAAFLCPAVARYGLRKEDFLAIIDGMQMDVDEDICAPDLGTLDLYCERVASAVGRLSIKVFGMDEGPGFELAHHLGRALQLTNILRDLNEDAAVRRLYLPREYLREAGIEKFRSSNGPYPSGDQPSLQKALRASPMNITAAQKACCVGGPADCCAPRV